MKRQPSKKTRTEKARVQLSLFPPEGHSKLEGGSKPEKYYVGLAPLRRDSIKLLIALYKAFGHCLSAEHLQVMAAKKILPIDHYTESKILLRLGLVEIIKSHSSTRETIMRSVQLTEKGQKVADDIFYGRKEKLQRKAPI